VWEEGRILNPEYRKKGCEMVVDTDSGDVSWIEADRMALEARLYNPAEGGLELLGQACIQRLVMMYGMQVMTLALFLG
jgi:hypothetical protein